MYSLGTVAFVGGSLVAAGGHNPLEPARFGVPVVMGRSSENFREVVERMRAMDGICVVTAEEMPGVLARAAGGTRRGRGRWGSGGGRCLRMEAGATGRTVRELLGLLGTGGSPGPGEDHGRTGDGAGALRIAPSFAAGRWCRSMAAVVRLKRRTCLPRGRLRTRSAAGGGDQCGEPVGGGCGEDAGGAAAGGDAGAAGVCGADPDAGVWAGGGARGGAGGSGWGCAAVWG